MPLTWEESRRPVGVVTLNLRSAGRGPTVLLLHGFPDNGSMWGPVAERLVARGLRVLAPDLRGFGESDAPPERRAYALPHLVADVIGLLDRESGEGPMPVIGHDWGAVLAWCLALWHPERVSAGVAVSVGHPREYAVAGLEQKRKGLYTLLWQFPGLAEASLRRDGHAGLRGWLRQHPQPAACLADMARPGRLTAGLNWYRANLVQVLAGRWPMCQVPMLGVWSSGDDFLAEDQMRRSARRMTARWEYVRIDGAGHWLPLERPEELARLALEWFGRVG